MKFQVLPPTGIKKIGNKELKITWADEHESIYDFRALRIACRCAMCVDEWTGKKLLMEASIPQNIACAEISVVGNYALRITFSDGHGTGIFSFESLRQLCTCADCRNAAATLPCKDA